TAPDRREQELHGGKWGEDDSANPSSCPEMRAIDREHRNDDSKPNQINEHREKNDQNGRFSHCSLKFPMPNPHADSNNIAQLYIEIPESQAQITSSGAWSASWYTHPVKVGRVRPGKPQRRRLARSTTCGLPGRTRPIFTG